VNATVLAQVQAVAAATWRSPAGRADCSHQRVALVRLSARALSRWCLPLRWSCQIPRPGLPSINSGWRFERTIAVR